MKGGWTAYRSAGATAIQKYFYSSEAEFDNYYFKDVEAGSAERMIYRAGAGVETVSMNAEQYEAWVDFVDPDTGESRGTVRKNSTRFVEKNFNVDKTLSLAAVDSAAVAVQLREAMREAVNAVTAYGGEHFTTRVTKHGRTRRVGLDQLEVAVIAHKSSRENEPHPHLHVQFGGRVMVDGRWRQVDTADAWKHSAVINALVEHTIHTHAGLRQALADHGLTFDPATGKVAELEAYVEQFSTRHAQIEHNKELLEANWRANPNNYGKTPGPALRSAWDHIAWNGTAELQHLDAVLIPRPEKQIEDPENLEQRWRAQLAEAGYRAPVSPVELAHMTWPPVETLVHSSLAALSGRHSSWSSADIRAEVLQQITAYGLITEPQETVSRLDSVVSLVAQQCRSMADPRITVPETARHWTTQHIIDTEDELKNRLAARAIAQPPEVSAQQLHDDFAHLNAAQAEAALALAAGTRLSVIEGYAGAGKTALLKAATQLRAAEAAPLLTVTPTLKAAQEARSAGAAACSLHKLLHANGYRWDQHNQWSRLAAGQADPHTGKAFYPPSPGDAYFLAEGTQLVVDEAGMLDQDATRALLELADEADADVALMGDRAQLSAVGRGGVLDIAARLTTHHVELDEVHRFGDDTEYAELSQKLRNRQDLPATFDQLYQRGNIRIHDTPEQARASVATEAAVDIAHGRSFALTVPTNQAATQLNAQLQAERIFAGQLAAHDNPATGSDGLNIYVGDTIMTRSNNVELGVANRDSFRVVRVHHDGELVVAGEDHRHHHIDADYVRDHVHLGYAVTDYGNQGTTVDHGAVLLEDGMSGGGAYVGATRGRHDNTVHIVADSQETAREKFMRILATDRADRGLDQARRELATELRGLDPEPAPAPRHPHVQKYLDNLHAMKDKYQRAADRFKPLAEFRQRKQAFYDTHGTNTTLANNQAANADKAAQKAQQQAEQLHTEIRETIYHHARSKADQVMKALQQTEEAARNAGFIGRGKKKTEADQQRHTLQDRYQHPVPRSPKDRLKAFNYGQDRQWVEAVARAQTTSEVNNSAQIIEAYQQAQQAKDHAHTANQEAERINTLWDDEVGTEPQVPNKHRYGRDIPTYEQALKKINDIDNSLARASQPENQDDLLRHLEQQAQRKAQEKPQRPKPTPALDPLSPAYRAIHQHPGNHGPETGIER